MLTRSLIAYIKRDAKDASADYIRELLNEVQKMVYTQKPLKKMQMYDSTTGKDPILATTAGTYEYTISTDEGFSDNAWLVTAVYTTTIDEPVEDMFLLDADPSNGYAKIVFTSDPGTQNYYFRGYKFPTEISSTTTPLTIPHAYHITHVAEGVLGLLEMNKSGLSRRWEMFINKLLPELLEAASSGNSKYFFVKSRGY